MPTPPLTRYPLTGWRAAAVPACGLAVAALAAYHNSFGGAFVFDDVASIVQNSSLRRAWPPWEALFPAQSGLTVSGRPVLNLSFALNYAMSGTRVWSYHALNLLIHLLAGLTLFGIVRRTLKEGGEWTAFCVALLWLVHPLQTGSVTYVVQRAESLMGLFYLLTLYGLIRGAGERSSRGRWLALSVLSCLLGMGAKEVMVSAPVMALLYDRTFLSGSFREAWRRRRVYYCALAATWLPLLWFVSTTGWSRGGAAGFGSGVRPGEYLLIQAYAVVHYLRLCLWPAPLIFDYGRYGVGGLPAVILPGLLLIALLFTTAFALVRRPPIGFLGAWFFTTLAPSSSLVPISTETVAEYRMYLPLAAVAAALVLGARVLAGRRGLFASIALAAALLVATAQRNLAYATPETLWRDTVRKLPGNPRAHDDYGLALLDAGRMPEALAELGISERLDPSSPQTQNNLGIALRREGRLPEAIAHFEAALGRDPAFFEARENLGVALREAGRLPEAVAAFEAAERLDPDSADARHNLGEALLAEGRPEDAIPQFEAVLRLDPASPGTEYDLGMALSQAGLPGAALDHYGAAVKLDPRSTKGRTNYGIALIRAGRTEEAIAQFQAAVALEPDLAPLHDNLGSALASAGRNDEAAAQFEAALRLDPADGAARRNLERLGRP